MKEDVTPSDCTDPGGALTSVYEVAPVIDGVEGERQGQSVPMLSALPGGSGQASRGAVHYIPLKPAPAPVPLAHFTYRGAGNAFGGPSTNLNAASMVIPGTGGQNWYVVDMDLLKGFRSAHEEQTTVTQEQLDGWVAAAQRAQHDAQRARPRHLHRAPAADERPGRRQDHRRAVRRARGRVHQVRREPGLRHVAALRQDRAPARS